MGSQRIFNTGLTSVNPPPVHATGIGYNDISFNLCSMEKLVLSPVPQGVERLPSSVQAILAAVSNLTLNKAADITDRMLEVSPSPIETFAVSNKN
ncbi:hypothetical protein TNCV_3377291 [Trichonephila clavipes]|nr:hypothetical protein TNCV_3377291 [Trichonephila clavipes]